MNFEARKVLPYIKLPMWVVEVAIVSAKDLSSCSRNGWVTEILSLSILYE